MNRILKSVSWLVMVASVGVAGCDFLDPTEVDNPATTTDDLQQAEEPTRALLPGLRAQFARAINPVAAEVVSDNYSVHGTGINKTMDTPRRITANLLGGGCGSCTYDEPQELRALAEFVINEIIPADADATPAQEQEARYYLGMSFLLLGQWFVAAPVEADGAPVSSDQLVARAITELEAARSAGGQGSMATLPDGSSLTVAIAAALAYAHRLAGDAAAAETEALAALGGNAGFAIGRDYDAQSEDNDPFTFLFLRSLKEMQPLPRLDFLDPKYVSREAPIYINKAEEMHLILAEVAFSRSDYAGGRERIALAIELAQSRSVEAFADDDLRLNEDLSERPHDASIMIRSDPNSPFRAGLVLTRPGTVNTPTVAGTSLDADSIRAIAASETESLRHALWLARQEMLMLEGKRMVDLGIRLPMSLTEVETNPNINEGDLGTEVLVPSLIPTEGQMDLFDPASPYQNGSLVTTMVTIRIDMNRVLAVNGVSPFGTLQ